MKRSFTVTLEMPKDVSVQDMETYILNAIAADKGFYDPIEPISALDSAKASVKYVPKKRKPRYKGEV